MNSFSSLLSQMLKFRRLGLSLLCSSCVHSIPPHRNKRDFYSFLSSLWVRAGGCQWGWCDKSNRSLRTPRFPAAAWTCHSCASVSPGEHPGTEGGLRGSPWERGRNAAAAPQGHRNHSRNEVWGETSPTWKDSEKTDNCSSYWVSGDGEERGSPAPCQGKPLGNGMGITQVHTLPALENISSSLLWCFLLLKYGETWNERCSCTYSKDFKAHLADLLWGAPFQHLCHVQTWHCHCAHPWK